MEYLLALKDLQEKYQQKFAAYLKLQEESSHNQTADLYSAKCASAKEEWLQASNKLKNFLEKGS
ncbi:MAG TPA: hypothetical protein VGB63_08510 [Pedobacter sp.]|jgi:hypothetical protein